MQDRNSPVIQFDYKRAHCCIKLHMSVRCCLWLRHGEPLLTAGVVTVSLLSMARCSLSTLCVCGVGAVDDEDEEGARRRPGGGGDFLPRGKFGGRC